MKVEASEQYIPKFVLVAELKKRFDYRVNGLKAINNGTFWDEDQSDNEFNAVLTRCAYNAAKNEVFELMCFLDTLEVKEVDLIIHTVIAECCDWLAMNTNLSHDKIEGCRNLMLTVKEEQFKAQKGE